MISKNSTHNSTSRILALGLALVIGAFLGGYLSGKRSAKATTKVDKGEEAIPAQPEVKAKAKASGNVDMAAEFRERHNRALSPEAREDNRRNLWEQNFPWKPTYDPAVQFKPGMSRSAIEHHFHLKNFFENELRFSPQFEQLCRIMEEYDRTENPLALAGIFEVLTDYHKDSRHNPEELVRKSDGRPSTQRKRVGGPFESYTWEEKLGVDKKVLYSLIQGGSRSWPHKEPMSDELVDSIIEELVNEVPGMTEVRGDFTSAGDKIMVLGGWTQSLKEGDSLLVPYEGYQAGLDEWKDNRQRALNEGFAKTKSEGQAGGHIGGRHVGERKQPANPSRRKFVWRIRFGWPKV